MSVKLKYSTLREGGWREEGDVISDRVSAAAVGTHVSPT